jgi:hypothetical protein
MTMGRGVRRRENRRMREELERHRESVEAQLRWAMLDDGDQELLELLRFESDRLSLRISLVSRSTSERHCLGAHAHQGERRAASSGLRHGVSADATCRGCREQAHKISRRDDWRMVRNRCTLRI